MRGGYFGERSHESTEGQSLFGEAATGPVGQDALEQGVDVDRNDEAGVKLLLSHPHPLVAHGKVGRPIGVTVVGLLRR